MIADRIRAFIDSLLPNRVVLLLRAELAEARKERDYFRGRCERLELMLVPNPAPRIVRQPAGTQPVGRKTWAQVQAENADRITKEIEAEKQKKEAAGG